jgi:hypothetical protein
VTPFDAAALLAMLRAFYPTVSGAELARARSERPEYFAGGVLFGTHGDKLRLPDGREFDLIFASGGAPGAQRWQVIEPGPAGDADPYALEEGPLAYLDPAHVALPTVAPVFEPLVAAALAPLAGDDNVLGAASSTVAEGAAAAGNADAGAQELDDAERAVDEIERARSAGEVAEVLEQSDGMHAAIDTTDAEHDQAPPEPRLPDPPDPIPYPSNEPPPPESGGSQPHDA